MKKGILLLAASTLVLLTACGPNKVDEQTAPDALVKADSVNEQKNLDSLFNAASKNVGSAKDSSEKK